MQEPTHMITATTPYRSGHVRAQALTALLAAGVVFNVISILLTTALIASGRAARVISEEEDIGALELLELGFGLLQLLVTVATVVLFCMWLYRAAQNLTALGNPRQAVEYSPGWAVGSFFVPFVNLVVPYRATKEVWAKSAPEVTTDNYVAPHEPSAPAYMKLWWAFWLVSIFVNNAAGRMYLRADTPSQMQTAAWLDLCGEILDIPAAFLAIAVVRGIDRRQEERARRVAYVGNVPPPPPVFSPPGGIGGAAPAPPANPA
jgi:Domain of unknown function (DUF4328)